MSVNEFHCNQDVFKQGAEIYCANPTTVNKNTGS